PMMSSSSSATDTIAKPPPSSAVESVTCDTCGFAEECTPAYIYRVKERHRGHWLCGLCAEAVKDEVVRSPTRISVEEALRRHTTFCHRFRSWSAEEEEDPIAVIGRILRRSLDGSPRRTTTRTSSSGALPGIDDVAARRSLLRSGSLEVKIVQAFDERDVSGREMVDSNGFHVLCTQKAHWTIV
ncbi:hypothetical protein HID58_038828, partial [Brassica napus]